MASATDPRTLRQTLLDVVDERNETVETVADEGARIMRRALAGVVVATVPREASEFDAERAMASPAFVRALRLAQLRMAWKAEKVGVAAAEALYGKNGRDEGPIARRHINARRKERERVVIAGIPRAGKTTLAVNWPEAIHTDEMVGKLDMAQAAAHYARLMDEPGPWVIEGVTAVRALRTWLRDNPDGKPCDRVIWLAKPRVPLTHGQAIMAKGLVTVWEQIRHELERRRVKIEEGESVGP